MINIINQTRHKDLEIYYPFIEEYYHKLLRILGKKDEYDLSIIIVGPITIHRINRDYRNIDRVTDVISFASLDSEDFDMGDRVELGDIFINRNRVYSQAEEYGHSVKREFLFLIVHGMLHLFGYDHMSEEEEKEMFALQKKVLGDLK